MKQFKAFMNWSSGKDAAMALLEVRKNKSINIECLLTSINEEYQRVSMHGVQLQLLEAQAKSLGIPLEIISVGKNPDMQSYNDLMHEKMLKMKQSGFTHSVFGDIFLEDLRQYREQLLETQGLKAVFPLWKRNTKELIEGFIDMGFKAVVVSCMADKIDQSFCGRLLDKTFLNDLPADVDPCGENGEFHTFCFDGPVFNQAIPFKKGEITYRSYPAPKSEKAGTPIKYGFWYCDLHLIRN